MIGHMNKPHMKQCVIKQTMRYTLLKLACLSVLFVLLQLGLLDQGSNCALFLDNTQLPYLEAYNALLEMGLLFMCPIIVQPNANVYSYTPKQVSLICITLQTFSGVSCKIDKRLLQMYPSDVTVVTSI